MEELYPHEGEIEPELLLGVDLTEYFGGTDLASAERVVVSQLKYSHRHPTSTGPRPGSPRAREGG